MTGIWKRTYVWSDASGMVREKDEPIDLTTLPIEALVLRQDGTFGAPTLGTGSADGKLTISGAPQGEYYLRVDNRYRVTSERSVTSTEFVPGRPDAVYATNPTHLVFSITGLSPWQTTTVDADGDWLEFFDGGTNDWDWLHLEDLVGRSLTSGATTLSSAAVDWSQSVGGPQRLINTTLGDAPCVFQLVRSQANMAEIRTVKKFGKVSNLIQVDGQSSDLAVALSDAAPNSSAAVDFRGSEFEALRAPAPVGPTEQKIRPSTYISTGPGEGGATADLLDVASKEDINLGMVMYANPFPDTWKTTLGASASSFLRFEEGTGRAYAFISVGASWAGASPSGPIRPVIGPPTGLQLDGLAIGKAPVAEAPLLSWTAPTLGTPTSYSVEIKNLYASPAGRKTVFIGVPGGRTSVRIPPGVLATGGKYFITLYAYSASASASTPSGYASVASPLFAR